jgi:hypothetical protein
MTKIFIQDTVWVPVVDRDGHHACISNQRYFPAHPGGHSDYGFALKAIDDKFKIRKYDNEFNRFRVEFTFPKTI